MARLVVVFALLVASYGVGTFVMSVNILASLQVPFYEWSNSSEQIEISPPHPGRFPKHGTHEFGRLCNWTAYRGNKRHCDFFVRPPPEGNEGIGSWVPNIMVGHLLAMQARCNIKFDYGPGVDLDEILLPPSSSSSSSGKDWNWTVSLDYDCRKESRCLFNFGRGTKINNQRTLNLISNMIKLDSPLANVPTYRFAYTNGDGNWLYPHYFRDLERALPGFKAEEGMACSLESLFRLSPKAAQFEPELFSRILPTLNRADSLVMSVYIRTGETDRAAIREKAVKQGKANATKGEGKDYRSVSRIIVDCALQQEKQHLEKGSYARVVWMVVSDSPEVKKWVTESFDTTRGGPVAQNGITREIVTTQARGVHSRAARGPSTADFAEALIDWYLIGESDFVVASPQLSFGGTAALRTARPFYDASKGCTRLVLIHDNTTTLEPKQ